MTEGKQDEPTELGRAFDAAREAIESGQSDAVSRGPLASEAQVKAAARMLVGLIEGAEVHSGVLDDIQQSAAFNVIKSWSKWP